MPISFVTNLIDLKLNIMKKNKFILLFSLLAILISCTEEDPIIEYVTVTKTVIDKVIEIQNVAIDSNTDSTLQGNITSDTTLDASKIWLLKGRVSVLDGVTLTIPAGMTIKAAATGKPLEAFFTLIDLGTGDTIAQASSDKENGSFLVVLPSSENYALMADKQGYLFHSENFELDLATNKSHYTKNIELQPIEAGRSVVLKNVFFDTDKFDLKSASKTELNKLTDLLVANPDIKIEISGHTDNQGNAAANQILSKNRAKAVYQFLMDHGISGTRLKYKGYGQSKPIATNDTEEGRALNRRTEFIVLE